MDQPDSTLPATSPRPLDGEAVVENNSQQPQKTESSSEVQQQQQQDEEDQEIDPTEFYLRYYVGHDSGQFGHEFLEFELRQDGTLRYGNNSEYKKDTLIRKSVKLGDRVIQWVKDQVESSHIIDADDSTWPQPDEVGRQEIEIKLNGVHIFFVTTKISSQSHLNEIGADDSLRIFYDLTHDIKQWFFDIIGLHFRLKNI